jgi:hypothetical protein
MQREKIIRRGKKCLFLPMKRVVGRDKIKCPTPKSWVEVIFLKLQMSIPI